MLLVLLVLRQTACPQYAPKQPDEVNMPIPGDHDGSESGGYVRGGAKRHEQ
jgi:hypothetical protein